MLATALAVRLDSRGPVLFKQRRYGFNNELIEVYKFRSMYVDHATPRLQSWSPKAIRASPAWGGLSAKHRWMSCRNSSMWCSRQPVPRRPASPCGHAKAVDKLYDDVVDGYFARHKVKPGITGWAQINGWRGETDTEEKIQRRVECDLYYIENWSLFLDLYILLKTPFALLKSENAY